MRLVIWKKDEVKHPTALHDLRALKLIMTNELGCLELVSNSLVATPEMLMRRSVSAMECIKVARAVMTVNPGAKAVEIADAVSLELGKNWTNEGTKRRNGNAIKRWLIWLEPHVLDPDESVDAAARLTMVGKSILGRPSLRGSVKERFMKMVEMDMSTAEIAEAFNVTRQTIYVWLRQCGLRERKATEEREAGLGCKSPTLHAAGSCSIGIVCRAMLPVFAMCGVAFSGKSTLVRRGLSTP
jgi:hypothetical protein